MNVKLTPEQETLVKDKIESGRFRTVEEVIGEALQALREKEHSSVAASNHGVGGMFRILVLVLFYSVMSTLFGFALVRGLLRPMPWALVYFVLMLALGTAFLRLRFTPRITPDFEKFLSRQRNWLLVAWVIVCLCGALYGILMLLSGQGDSRFVGVVLGATIWGLFLVFILRIIYKKNRQSGLHSV